MPNTLTFEWLLGPRGFEASRTLHLDPAGRIERIEAARDPHRDGYLALPGMTNAHSHVFQYALRGCGERGGLGTFWQWRAAMYALAETLTPEDLHAIATVAFVQMLEAGYTAVAEFHYLHHLPDGSRSGAMMDAVVAAASDAGIRLGLLPVYYRRGGFDRPAEAGQRRFVHRNLDDFAKTLARCGEACVGLAAHSLRAVPSDELAGLVSLADRSFGPASPLHIHVSEQPGEVRDCVRHHGRPPVLVLAEAVELDRRWNLVHATHAGLLERERIVESGATVVLCPLTEGQLGDGVFPAGEFHDRGGRIAIGSDSNVRIDAWEELRSLEFAQRALTQRRNVLSGPAGTGATLWCEAARCGAESIGGGAGRIAPGYAADLLVVPRQGLLAGVPPDAALDVLLLAAGRGEPVDVYVGGRLRVAAGKALAPPDAGRLERILERIWSR
jgi:formimidoylglutamate deiminase